MAGKDIIMLTQEELKKLHIIRPALDRKIKQIEAADMLSLSDRQIRRLTARIRQEGFKKVTIQKGDGFICLVLPPHQNFLTLRFTLRQDWGHKTIGDMRLF